MTSLVTLECAGDDLVGVTVPEQAEPAVGATVTAVPDPGRLLLYYGETGELLGEADGRPRPRLGNRLPRRPACETRATPVGGGCFHRRMDASILVAFVVACAVISLVPGPDMMFIVANGIARGRVGRGGRRGRHVDRDGRAHRRRRAGPRRAAAGGAGGARGVRIVGAVFLVLPRDQRAARARHVAETAPARFGGPVAAAHLRDGGAHQPRQPQGDPVLHGVLPAVRHRRAAGRRRCSSCSWARS